MMTALVSNVKLVFDSTRASGDWAELTAPNFGQPAFKHPVSDTGTRVTIYTVPNGKKLRLENIVITGTPVVQQPSPAGGAANAGLLEVLVNGVARQEVRLLEQGWTTPQQNTTYQGLVNGFYPPVFGDGLQLSSGETIAFRFTPADARPRLVQCQLFTTESGVPNVATARVVLTQTTVSTLLTYTAPVGGASVLRLSTDARVWTDSIWCFLEVFIDGTPVSHTWFNNALNTKNAPNVLQIPSGIELMPGQSVNVTALDARFIGNSLTATVYGDLSDLGGVSASPIARAYA
jgi:hypothetical protein